MGKTVGNIARQGLGSKIYAELEFIGRSLNIKRLRDKRYSENNKKSIKKMIDLEGCVKIVKYLNGSFQRQGLLTSDWIQSVAVFDSFYGTMSELSSCYRD